MGAWEHIYKRGLDAEDGTPTGYGILAVKAELAYNDAADPLLNLDTTVCGNAFDRSAKAFQVAERLIVDGEVGRITAAALFRRRAHHAGLAAGVPNNYVCKIMHLESACDPGAVGYTDPNDLGLLQIHMPAHPTITVAQAFSPSFAITWAASTLASAYRNLQDWDATVASWNVGGGGAAAWLDAGKPSSLYVSWFTDQNGDPIDLGARATEYLTLVKGQTC